MKKFAGLVLALAMIFSLSATALAAGVRPLASSPGTTGTLTIRNAVAGEEYRIYQIFDLTYSAAEGRDASADSSYSYRVTDSWREFFANEGSAYITLDANGYVSAFTLSGEDADFAKAALAYAEENGIQSTAVISFTYDEGTGTATGNGGCSVKEGSVETEAGITTASIEQSGLPLGYYLVGTSLGSLCMLDSTDATAEIDEKNPTPTLGKHVRDITEKDAEQDYTEQDNADVVDTLEYEIVLSDISNSHNLCFHDFMDADMVLEEGSVKVYLNGRAQEDLVEEAYYELTIYDEEHSNGEDDCCFEIRFTDSFLETLSLTDKLYIVYTVTLDEEEEWTGDIHDFHNVARLSYGSVTTSPLVQTETYSYGFEIFKYTLSDDVTTGLAGAEFLVMYVDGAGTMHYAMLEENHSGQYVLAGWTTEEGKATVLTTPATGMLYVEGFDPDTDYQIRETAAPDGYNLLLGDVTVRIRVDGSDPGSFTVSYSYNGTDTEATDHVVRVLNNKGALLPGTGGSGTVIFYIIGAIFVAGAVLLLILRRRMNRAL